MLNLIQSMAKPPVSKIVGRELYEAQVELLRAQQYVEYHTQELSASNARVDVLRKRIQRLQEHQQILAMKDDAR